VLFAGNGVTGAVGLLIDCLNLRGWVEAAEGKENPTTRPVVFVGPHEHHSNLLPWRESGCQVVAVPARPNDDMVDLRELDRLLRLPEYGARSNRLRLGAFSAASNVTGMIADVDAIAVILHRHEALALFDYASGAPYCGMDMNPNPPVGATYEDYLNGDVYRKFAGRKGERRGATDSADFSEPSSPPPNPSKDAVYFSPHKCFGGTSTPGVLVAKKHLVSQTNPPSISGGGTVFYVTNTDHRFLSNRIERYEGGTPDGIGIQRVGLAMLVGRRVGREFERIVHSVAEDHDEDADDCVAIKGAADSERKTKNAMEREGEESLDGVGSTEKILRPLPKSLLEFECSTYDRIVSELKKHAPNLIVLGTTPPETDDRRSSDPNCIGRHLPIFSFLIRCGRRFLHYNYVCAILNDVFGIQSRGGCQCAGPYSQRLLGLTKVVVTTATTQRGDDRHPTERIILKREEVPNETNRNFERALLRSDRPCELLRPGYTRLSLPFKGLRDEEAEYVLRALMWVAANGWALLPQYRCDHRTGEWRHWSRRGKPLGKRERRWLSHFDVLGPRTSVRLGDAGEGVVGRGRDTGDGRGEEDSYDEITRISRARLERAMKNADAILEEAKSNPRYVSEVEKMNPVDGMLGSGGGDDPGAGGMDDTLEQLRWYVYQRECAPYLRDGLDQVPETMDDDALLGGIYVRMDGKKRVVEEVCELVEEANNTMDAEPIASEQSQPIVSQSLVPESGLIPFREDEHMGEAPYDEIKAGFDDGELTDQCVLYHTIKDEWVPIEEFIRDYESNIQDKSRKRDLSTMTESGFNDPGIIPTAKESMEIDEPPSCDGINSMKIDSATPTVTDIDVRQPAELPAAVQKREKKKPSRDSSQWGQSSAPHIGPASSCAIGSVQNGGSNGSNVKGQEGPVSSGAKVIESMETEPVEGKSKKSIKKGGKVKPPPKMMRNITQAMVQWDMIQEGDRLLLGLSGGKDSLSLLHCLLEFQRKLPTKFEIEVCTIDPMTPSFDPSPLIPYVESFGLKYHYIRDDIVERANSAGKDGKTVSSLCAFCARMKRGNLYNCARKNNCNKLVLAQHLDDCAESFLMSVMHNGFVRTMKANYRINAGDISVIRPLVYCRESLMTEFAKEANLPVINENCPACFEEPKERARVKKLLSREETLYPNLYDHIRRALIPIMHDDSTAILRSYLEETVAKSRKVPYQGRKGKGKSNNDCPSEEKKESELPSHPVAEESASPSASISLASATEEQLVAELARRRAAKFALSGAMKRLPGGDGDDDDPTGQVCSLLGGNGTIPCRELME